MASIHKPPLRKSDTNQHGEGKKKKKALSNVYRITE